jgi:hypothetical protein
LIYGETKMSKSDKPNKRFEKKLQELEKLIEELGQDFKELEVLRADIEAVQRVRNLFLNRDLWKTKNPFSSLTNLEAELNG